MLQTEPPVDHYMLHRLQAYLQLGISVPAPSFQESIEVWYSSRLSGRLRVGRVSCVTTRKPIIRHLRYATKGSHFSTADRSWLVFLNQMISRQMCPLLTHNRRLFSS